MRKQWLMGLALSLVLLAGCSASNVVKTYESGQDNVMVTYQELKDGTWKREDTVYQYRLELTGTLPNAQADSHYVVLSQREDVTHLPGGLSGTGEQYGLLGTSGLCPGGNGLSGWFRCINKAPALGMAPCYPKGGAFSWLDKGTHLL